MTDSLISLPAPPITLTGNDPGWPAQLRGLARPPVRLRVAGTLPALERAVAIVGTRFADEEAATFARQLASALAQRSVPVLSGGAEGIDAAAHEGALQAGGTTLAVLATGLRRAYPRAHGPLFSRIAVSGALVCEGDDRGRPVRWAFLQRNRLIAALATSVVVVQAPLRSGALSTAAWAKRLHKRVFAVPSAPWDARSAGSLRLLLAGCDICTSAADVLSLRPSEAVQGVLPWRAHGEDSNDDAGLPPSSRDVLRALRGGPSYPDELCARLDMAAPAVQEALLTLALSGLVSQRADGRYATTSG